MTTKDLSDFHTRDGKSIYPLEYIVGLREKEDKASFIAQSGAQELGLSNTADIVVFGGNRGGGKANSVNTLVATPNGYKKMGALEIGDEICTPYDGVQKVSGIYDQGWQAAYTVCLDDGTKVVCMDDHRFWARLGEGEDFREMTAREIFDRYVINAKYPVSLRQDVFEYAEIPLCGEVAMNEDMTPDKLPIHPFALGHISGDGTWTFGKEGITLRGGNHYTSYHLSLLGYKVTLKPRSRHVWQIRGIPLDVCNQITTRRTRQDAHIPEMYKTASVQSRWEYLWGVISISVRARRGKKNPGPYICLKNKKFIEEIADLARSLGIYATVYEETEDQEKWGWWNVSLKAPNDAELYPACKVNYSKSAKVNANKATSPYSKGILTKKILQIKKDNVKRQFRCITVTGKDHLYLTEGYNINHNTVTMLMEPLYDISNRHFNGIIFRKNKDDFENIINESNRWFDKLGKYNKSKDDMTWNFRSGAKLGFWYYDMPMVDFDIKFRGQQFAYIGIDELPQIPFEMFKFLMTCNRNTFGVHSRILGTCNPDPLSWLRKFVDWWIGKEDTVYSDGQTHPELKGFAIPERDGVVRYCYMPDDSVDNIVWGNTPEEVYEQCRELIDDAWDPEWEKYGYTKTSFFVKSVTFIKASLKDNKALLKNDPSYVANLLNQPPEIRAREFDGNWDIIKTSNDMIQASHLDSVFRNAQKTDDGVRRASCDVAGTGGDNCVTWLWVGWHIADVFVCRRDPFNTASLLKAKLQEWGVLEQNFTYDLNGMGQVLKGAFPNAVPFNNLEAVAKKDKNLYDNIKSQCAYRFAERTQQCEWSIEHSLLSRKYQIGKETRTLYDILQTERKCVRQDMSKSDKGWCLIHKEQMKHKSLVGHSPDFFEALFMREIFDIKKTQAVVPEWAKSSHGKFVHRRLIRR